MKYIFETVATMKEYNNKKSQKTISNLDAFLEYKEEINGINVLIAISEGYDVKTLKQLVDALSNSLNHSLVLLANVSDNSVNFICKTNIVDSKINCGDIIKQLASKCNGNGGGSKVYAQGGGKDATNIAEYLSAIKEELKKL